MKIHKNKKIIIGFTSFWDNDIKLNMLNEFERLKSELSVLYPDVTDIELNEMTNNLIAFYTTAVKAILEDENQETKEFVVDDKNFKNNLFPSR